MTTTNALSLRERAVEHVRSVDLREAAKQRERDHQRREVLRQEHVATLIGLLRESGIEEFRDLAITYDQDAEMPYVEIDGLRIGYSWSEWRNPRMQLALVKPCDDCNRITEVPGTAFKNLYDLGKMLLLQDLGKMLLLQQEEPATVCDECRVRRIDERQAAEAAAATETAPDTVEQRFARAFVDLLHHYGCEAPS